jgi:hypothetical protein
MRTRVFSLEVRSVGPLLRGDAAVLRAWVQDARETRLALCLGVILVGAGLYGASVGCWRAPQQALFVAVKLPLIILLTTLGNALLNAMLAPLLGLNISLRQSVLAILMSFAIASAILGAFSPLAAFLVWNVPPLSPDARLSNGTHSLILLTHVGVIAFAGLAANLRLVQLLGRLSGNVTIARRVLVAWLAGNLFLGSQVAWILRPFIGSPGLPVQFLRPDPLRGSFYETVFHALLRLLNSQ